MQASGEVELLVRVMESLRIESHRLQLATPVVAFHLDFSQGEQDVPVRVKPGLQVHIPASVSMKVVWQTHFCWVSLKSVYWEQGVHPAEPSKLQPDSQSEQVSAPPTEKVPAAQFSTPRWSDVGFVPATAVLHDERPVVSAYWPSPEQLILEPPTQACPAEREELESECQVGLKPYVIRTLALTFTD